MTDQKPPQGAPPPPAGELQKANSTRMVTVGCKLPNGLICELGTLGSDNHTVVRLNGTNSSRVVGGYGLTDVSEEFWTAWHKKNKNLEFVRKGFVFAHGTLDSAQAHAKELSAQVSGFEPLDPSKGIVDAQGKPLVSTDMNHFNQGRQDLAQQVAR